jgi:hypothetical protein
MSGAVTIGNRLRVTSWGEAAAGAAIDAGVSRPRRLPEGPA